MSQSSPIRARRARARVPHPRVLCALVLAAGLAACAHERGPAMADWPDDYRERHPVRVAYSGHGRAEAVANPCGLWPDHGQARTDNRSYYNFGCASQRNLAAMVENPRDLAGPRALTPRDATRQQTVIGAYGRGEATASETGANQAGGISDIGG